MTSNYVQKNIYLEGSQSYGFGSYLINHDFYFNFELPDYSYSKYDWDGHTRSESRSYDTVKNELRNAGIKMSFASDCKKVASNFVKQAKKLPQSMIYSEACEAYNAATANNSYDDFIKELRGGLPELLTGIGFSNMQGGLSYQGRIKFAILFGKTDDMRLQAYGGVYSTKRELASMVKSIAQKYPEYFTVVRVPYSIIPELRINPELLKMVKSVKK